MKTLEVSNINKSEWGEGAWQNEPDKVQWPDEATGLPCLAVRNPSLGHWCGYVGVAEGHPYFSKPYSELDVDVHGGLTYADFCMEEKDVPTGHNHICHIPEPGEPDRVWWLGFDCAHSGDLSPFMEARSRVRGWHSGREGYEKYRTLAYVKSQCRELARQLAAMQSAG